ncbi:hypothetical protein SAMN05660226_02610 [Parapedobacter luteus]|uniref:Uncharacterized protein n=1 Tax=Parapedobacter luteus TaxID=623280 RepID=A0A1T5D8Q2_9SPHI|nr:hypothetical protein SAMN05660226_02610 [Parapedobacter luteus]
MHVFSFCYKNTPYLNPKHPLLNAKTAVPLHKIRKKTHKQSYLSQRSLTRVRPAGSFEQFRCFPQNFWSRCARCEAPRGTRSATRRSRWFSAAARRHACWGSVTAPHSVTPVVLLSYPLLTHTLLFTRILFGACSDHVRSLLSC